MSDEKRTPEGKVIQSLGDGLEMEIIYDEELVPEFTLKDPLIMNNGKKAQTEADWRLRRQELLEIFKDNIYGKTPATPYTLSTEILEDWAATMEGKAKRKQIRFTITTEFGSHSADMLIIAPANTETPVPAVLGLNFAGNQIVLPDPEIKLAKLWWKESPTSDVACVEAKEEMRGTGEQRWPAEKLIDAGLALATIYYGDIAPDDPSVYKNGFFNVLYGEDHVLAADDCKAIGLWAFGLSRALDVLEQEPAIDASKVTVTGTSRLGKTALWAGVQDERFFIVIDNESGCGGSALNKRGFGEHVKAINVRFPHWFCDNYSKYNDNELAIPMDSHGILALAAPRPLYVGAAEEDKWSDSRGMYEAAKAASPVYEFLGKPGLPMKEFPEVSQTDFSGQMAYHLRPGGHGVTLFDWIQFIEFIKVHLQKA